ncbi:MAG: hypothetical protein J6A25_00535 [Lachnospiraceae bacterium]|nr:hypothetical protein [Lachnospiraceae bacterium]
MTSDIKNLLKKLEIEDTGRYDNQFYVIDLENSNAYARMYTKLDRNATNLEFPTLDFNTNSSLTKLTNYFETEEDNTTYQIFLIGDYDEDKYILKIGEK